MNHDWTLIAIDITRHIDATWRAKHGITHVAEIYLFDRNQAVHCCEITPSYEMISVGFEWETSLDRETVRDEVDEDMQSWSGDVTYMHCSLVDSICKDAPKRCHFYGPDHAESTEEDMIEAYGSNPPYVIIK